MTTLREVSLAINLLTVLVVVVNVLLVIRYRRVRYSAGWIEGRMALLMSMVEAQRRGIPAEEWVEAEAQRDAANHLPGLMEALARRRALEEDQ